MNKQDLYALCTLIPPMDDYSGHNMYLCGKRDGFNECVKMLKENLKNIIVSVVMQFHPSAPALY